MEDRAATRLLYALKSAGPQTAAALGRRLGMAAVGARQHLARLLAAGLVGFAEHRESVGRPKRVWSITEAGDRRFPDNHAGLTLDLIDAIRATLGEAGLERIIAARERQALKAYRARLAGAGTLRDKVKRLAALRSGEGYMAELQRDRTAVPAGREPLPDLRRRQGLPGLLPLGAAALPRRPRPRSRSNAASTSSPAPGAAPIGSARRTSDSRLSR